MNRNWIKIVYTLIIILLFVSCARMKKWQEAHTPPDDSCIHCHGGIYGNWKISYRPYNELAKTEDYSPVHSRPMSSEDVKMKKVHMQGEGDCADCHAVQNPQESLSLSMLGASFEDTVFQVCGRCHNEIFRQWKETDYFNNQVSCLECHARRREEIAGTGGSFPHKIREMQGFDPSSMMLAVLGDKLKKTLAVEKSILGRRRKLGVKLVIINDGSGHDLPAKPANNALTVRLDLSDRNGFTVDSKESLIAGNGSSAIPYGKKVYFNYEKTHLERGEYSVEVRIVISGISRKVENRVLLYHDKFKVVID